VTASARRRRPPRRSAALRTAAVGALLLLAAAPATALDVPFLGSRVDDLAGVLSPAARDRIESKLAELEKRTGAQVAVLTVTGLEGESLEDYSVRVAQTWKLGRKGIDDGVLFLVAKNDHKMRIEVGYGLESKLTDALSHQILDERVRPRFRAGDWDGGIEAGVDAIAAIIEGKAPAAAPALPRSPGSRRPDLLLGLVMGAIFLGVVGVHSLIALLSPGARGWLLYAFLMPFYLVFPSFFFRPYAGVVAVAAWIVLFPILRHFIRPGSPEFRRSHPGLAGFAGGHAGPSGSGGGGWSSGGGGFSGGGGGFGGGGSSGSW